MATIGENIKRLRIAAGIPTQTAFAKLLGVPQPQVSDWENDRYETPDVRTLARIACAIRQPIDALIEDTPFAAPRPSDQIPTPDNLPVHIPGQDAIQHVSVPATAAGVSHDPDSLPLPRHLAKELSRAALNFYEWHRRFAKLAGAAAINIGRQAATSRAAQTSRTVRRGRDRGRDDLARKRPRKRKAG